MKNLLLSFLCLLTIQYSYAQNLSFNYCKIASSGNDTSLLHFSDSVWQFGSSNKSIAQSLSRPILITDTLNSYPPSATTSFVASTNVITGAWNMNGTDSVVLTVDIAFDTDSLVDFATFYYSCDSGMTWQLLEFANANVYGSKYSIDAGPWVYNDNPPLSGKFRGRFEWKVHGVWYCFPYMTPSPNDGAYFSVRVDFTSDSIDTSKEGIAITTLCFDVYGVILNSIEEHSARKLNAFPNPTNGIVQLDANQFTEGILNIYSAQGKLIEKLDLATRAGNQIEIDLSNCPAGIYSLQFIGGGQVAYSSIVKID